MTIFSIIIGIMLAVEAFMLIFCKYWCDNNPVSAFIFRTLTAIAVVAFIAMNGEYDLMDMVVSFIIGFGVALDTVNLIMLKKGK